MESFDNFASDYKGILDKSLALGGEGGEYFANYKASYLIRQLGEGFSGSILDYGCGIGLLSLVLANRLPSARLCGFDVSALSIEQVPDFLKARGAFTSMIHQLPAPFDVVVLANVLHHVETPERQEVIRQVKGLLKPGGKIVIFEHNPLNPLTRKIVRESPLDKGVTLLPSPEVLSYLNGAGFSQQQREYIVFFPKFLSALRPMEPWLKALPLGAQYAVQGKA